MLLYSTKFLEQLGSSINKCSYYWLKDCHDQKTLRGTCLVSIGETFKGYCTSCTSSTIYFSMDKSLQAR